MSINVVSDRINSFAMKLHLKTLVNHSIQSDLDN